MKNLIIPVFLMILSPITGKSQDQSYVIEGINYHLGIGLGGPKTSVGLYQKNKRYHELSFQYSTFEFGSQEDLINKPSSGGYYIGYDYFLNMSSNSKFKFHVGTGYGIAKEESGKNTGFDLEGEHSIIDLHTGVRFYPIKRVSINLWLGYPIYQNGPNSIAEQLGFEDDIKIFTGSFDLLFRLNK